MQVFCLLALALSTVSSLAVSEGDGLTTGHTVINDLEEQLQLMEARHWNEMEALLEKQGAGRCGNYDHTKAAKHEQPCEAKNCTVHKGFPQVCRGYSGTCGCRFVN